MKEKATHLVEDKLRMLHWEEKDHILILPSELYLRNFQSNRLEANCMEDLPAGVGPVSTDGLGVALGDAVGHCGEGLFL